MKNRMIIQAIKINSICQNNNNNNSIQNNIIFVQLLNQLLLYIDTVCHKDLNSAAVSHQKCLNIMLIIIVIYSYCNQVNLYVRQVSR